VTRESKILKLRIQTSRLGDIRDFRLGDIREASESGQTSCTLRAPRYAQVDPPLRKYIEGKPVILNRFIRIGFSGPLILAVLIPDPCSSLDRRIHWGSNCRQWLHLQENAWCVATSNRFSSAVAHHTIIKPGRNRRTMLRRIPPSTRRPNSSGCRNSRLIHVKLCVHNVYYNYLTSVIYMRDGHCGMNKINCAQLYPKTPADTEMFKQIVLFIWM